MADVGRPSLIDDELTVTGFLECIERRQDDTSACAAMGLAISTLAGWKRQGREDLAANIVTKYSTFMQDYEKAYNAATVEALEQIRVAGDTHWQASAWWLERKRRKQYSMDYAKFELNGITDAEKINSVIEGMNNGDINRDYGLRLIAVYQKNLELVKIDDMAKKLDELESKLNG